MRTIIRCALILLRIAAASAQKVRVVGQFMLNYKEANITKVIWTQGHGGEMIFNDEDIADLVDVYNETGRKLQHIISFMEKVPPLNETALKEHLIVIPNKEVMRKVTFSAAFLANNVVFSFVDNDDNDGDEVPLGDSLRIDSNLYVFNEDEHVLYERYKLTSSSRDDDIKWVKYAEFNETQNSLILSTEKTKWNRRSDLNGLILRASFVEVKPQVYKSDNDTYEGIMYDVIKTLEQDMNFSLTMHPQKIYGELFGNGTWIGVMGELQTSAADISIADLSITELRSLSVDFALGIYQQSCRIFLRIPRQSLSWTTFVDVFDHLFWIALACITVVASALFHFIIKLTASALTTDKRNPMKSLSSVLLSLGALSVTEDPHRLSSRSLFFTICLFGAIVYWSYNAILVSLLTVEFYVLPIKSLDELLHNRDYQLMTSMGSAIEQYFSESTHKTNPVAYDLYQETMKGNPEANVGSSREANDIIMEDDKMVYFWEKEGGKLNMDDYPCKITFAPKDYFKNYVSFAFPKGSPYVDLFSEKILAMKQSGQVEKILGHYLRAKDHVTCSNSNFKEIKFENIFTAFLALAVGILLAWIVAVAEKTA